jgi:ADP-heptose:LPS heptosyltransferase
MQGSTGSTERVNPTAYGRIVIFFANALGDHLMALPTLRAVSAALDGRFTLATAASATDLLFGGLRCERVVQIPLRWSDGFFDPVAVSQLLGPIDLFISINYWHNPSLTTLIQHLPSTVTVGFNPRFGHAISADPSRHHVDQVFQVCEVLGLGGTPDAHAYPFPLPPASVEFAKRLRAALGPLRLAVGHFRTKPDKTWPIAAVNRAIDRFLDEHPTDAVVVLGKREEDLVGLSPRAIPLAGLPLASAAAVIAAADLFVGVDSFPLHVADMWNVPGVGLFGPTSSAKWGFRFTPRAVHVDGNGSMAAIDPDAVAAALGAVAAGRDVGRRPDLLGNATAPDVTLRYR